VAPEVLPNGGKDRVERELFQNWHEETDLKNQKVESGGRAMAGGSFGRRGKKN